MIFEPAIRKRYPISSSSNVRIGIVGLGFGLYGHLAAFRSERQCEIWGVCGKSPEKAQQIALKHGVPRAYFSWHEMIEDPEIDAISIATPPALQGTIAEAALRAGKGVFAEKLLAPTLASANQLCGLAQEAGVPNMVNFLFPELATWRRAQELLESGAVGRLRQICVHWYFENYDLQAGISTWKTTSTEGGGVLRHFGIHVLNYMEWLGGPVSRLLAASFTAPDLTRAQDLISISILFSSGSAAIITLCNSAVRGSGHNVDIYGNDGCLFLRNTGADPVLDFLLLLKTKRDDSPELVYRECSLANSTNIISNPAAKAQIDSRVLPVSRIVHRFVGWARSHIPAVPSFSNGARAVLLLDAVCRSVDSGSWVSID